MLDISVLKRDNFSPEEFTQSNTARVERIDNDVYNQDVLDNLCLVADKAQEIRNLLNKAVKINSGYRCLKLNRFIGSKDTSQHVKGQAIDFIAPSFGEPKDIIKFLKDNNVIVDQCLMEGSWIHLSICKENMFVLLRYIVYYKNNFLLHF
jgi:hypothetical protein